MNQWITKSMSEWKKIGNKFEWLSFGSDHMDSIHWRLNTKIERWRWWSKQNKNLSGWNRITISCVSSTCSNYYITETFIISWCHRFLISGSMFIFITIPLSIRQQQHQQAANISINSNTNASGNTNICIFFVLFDFILNSQFSIRAFIHNLHHRNFNIPLLIWFHRGTQISFILSFVQLSFHFIPIHSFSFHDLKCFCDILNIQNDMNITFWIWMKSIVDFGMNFLKWMRMKNEERRTKNEEYSRNEMKCNERK
jgi:hypothetical protein